MKKISLDERIARAFESNEETAQPLENQTLNLKKVKVAKNDKDKTTVLVVFQGRFYDSDSGERSPVEQTISVQAEPHDDLWKQLRRLAPHLALVTEYTSKGKNFADAIETGKLEGGLEKFGVGTIVFSGEPDDDNRGVQLFGTRLLKTSKKVPFGTPLVKLEDSKTDYEFNIALDRCLDDLIDEVQLFLGGKQKPSSQLQMELEEEAA